MDPFIALRSAQEELDHLIASRDFLRCAEVQSKIDLLSQLVARPDDIDGQPDNDSRLEVSRLEDSISTELTSANKEVGAKFGAF